MWVLLQHILNVVVHKVKQTVHPAMVLGLPDSLDQSDALAVLGGLGHGMADQ